MDPEGILVEGGRAEGVYCVVDGTMCVCVLSRLTLRVSSLKMNGLRVCTVYYI